MTPPSRIAGDPHGRFTINLAFENASEAAGPEQADEERIDPENCEALAEQPPPARLEGISLVLGDDRRAIVQTVPRRGYLLEPMRAAPLQHRHPVRLAAEALADDIATELARSRSLRVLARGSVAPHAGPPPDLAALGREIGVDYTLEGRLDFGPSGVRVAARLIDTGTGTLAWSARYERPGDDLFAIRDPLAS